MLLSRWLLYISKHLWPTLYTYHLQRLLHDLPDHVGRSNVFNPQRQVNGVMFFSLSDAPLVSGLHPLGVCVTPSGLLGFSLWVTGAKFHTNSCFILASMSPWTPGTLYVISPHYTRSGSHTSNWRRSRFSRRICSWRAFLYWCFPDWQLLRFSNSSSRRH